MYVYNFRDLEQFANRFYNGAPLEITPWDYSLTFAGLAPGVTAIQNLNFQANADFIFTEAQYFANITGTASGATPGTRILPFVRMLLTDSGSSQPLSNTAIALPNYSEGGDFEKGLPYPRFFSGRSSLQVSLANYSGTETYDIDVSFRGVNVRAVNG